MNKNAFKKHFNQSFVCMVSDFFLLEDLVRMRSYRARTGRLKIRILSLKFQLKIVTIQISHSETPPM